MAGLIDILLPEAILPRFGGGGLKSVIAELSALLAAAHNLDKKSVQEAIMTREHLGSTGIGFGVALPHARIEGLPGPTGGFASLVKPVACDAVDGQPCDLIFVLLAPKKEGSGHVRALAQVSRLMSQNQIRSRLRAATSVREIVSVLGSEPTDQAVAS